MKAQSSAITIEKVDIRLLIKLAIYTLLFVNFILYIRDDWQIAVHTMRNGGSFLDWTAAFATTIDETAWLMLILMFELETYLLSDEILDGPVTRVIHVTRFVCYLFLCHSLYAYGIAVYDLSQVTPILDITNLCQLANADISYAVNLEYTLLNQGNCAALSSASQFFFIDPDLVVTDTSGLTVERNLAWIDLLEVVFWLCILFTIELIVRLQERGITKGTLLTSVNISKLLFYLMLWVAIAYWIYKGHFMFAWDEFVWIVGFFMIELNVVEWRNEIIEADSPIIANGIKT